MTQQGSRGEEDGGEAGMGTYWGDLEVGKGEAEGAQIQMPLHSL